MLKTLFRLLLAGAALGFSACGDPTVTKAPDAPLTVNKTDINFNSPDLYAPMKGVYIFGEGVESFTPCGSEKDYWVFTASEELWSTLRDKHQDLAAKPYGGIFAEVNGWLGPKLHPIVGGEYAADFDGHIVIDDIISMEKISPSDCQ